MTECKTASKTPGETQALLEALEQAEEGSREVDSAIAEHFGITHCAGGGWPFTEGSQLDKETPHYTTSIDAALTLVPEGMALRLSILHGDGGDADCLLWTDWDTMAHDIQYFDTEDIDNEIERTPALALCIAALRARQQQEAEG